MRLAELRTKLRGDLDAPACRAVFEAARTVEPAFGAYADLAGVLAALADETPAHYPEREALARALVRRQQQEPGPTWTGALTVGFYPMLARLASRLRGDALPPEERDQLLVALFLECASSRSLSGSDGRTGLLLRQTTARRLFALVRAEQRERALLVEVPRPEPEPFCWPEVLSRRQAREAASPSADEVERQTAFLVAVAGGRLPHDRLELLLATLVRGESVRAYVERLRPELPAGERERLYARLKRQRSRTLVVLRRLLARTRRPPSDDAPLCLDEAATAFGAALASPW